jgi:hypothetical protein
LPYQHLCQRPRAAAIVGDDGRRLRSGQVEIDAGNTCFATGKVERRRILNAREEQKLDPLVQKRPDEPPFDVLIPLGAHHDGAQTHRTGCRLEALGETGEEPVPVMRDQHSGETGFGQSKALGLPVDPVTKKLGRLLHAASHLRADPVPLPRSVEDHAHGSR